MISQFHPFRKIRRADRWQVVPNALKCRRMVPHSRTAQSSYKVFPFKSGRSLPWKEFVQAFERFTDLLVISARDGCTDKLEAEYHTLRKWLVRRYLHIGRHLLPYLGSTFAGENGSNQRSGSRYTRRLVQLPALMVSIYRSSTIGDLLKIDSGDLITNVSRFSDAIYKCDQELTVDS